MSLLLRTGYQGLRSHNMSARLSTSRLESTQPKCSATAQAFSFRGFAASQPRPKGNGGVERKEEKGESNRCASGASGPLYSVDGRKKPTTRRQQRCCRTCRLLRKKVPTRSEDNAEWDDAHQRIETQGTQTEREREGRRGSGLMVRSWDFPPRMTRSAPEGLQSFLR